VPELPDVEVYKQYVDSTALHQRIETVEVRSPALLDGCTTPSLQKALAGTAIACRADPDRMPADHFLLPHRDGDQRDSYSGADLKTVTVAGRTGYYSPVRQPGPEESR
jgi:hypothetical protein